jgi:GTPase involved in cell partitioning and DNA repair
MIRQATRGAPPALQFLKSIAPAIVLVHVINLDETDSRAAILSRQDGGE